MKIATWNVNGVRARGEQIHAWIDQEELDVVCLQEIKASPEQVPALLTERTDYWTYWHGFKGYSGVALLVKKTFAPQPEFLHPHFNMEYRIAMASIAGITIASVYAPNGGKDFPAKLQFFAALDAFVQEACAKGEPLLLCGDFNIAHHPMDVHPKERREVIGQLPAERSIVDNILSHGMVDLGRSLAPDDEGLFTWWAPWREMRKRNIGWRLDYFYASKALAKKVVSCVVQSSVGTSDHAPVVATFNCRPACNLQSRDVVMAQIANDISR